MKLGAEEVEAMLRQKVEVGFGQDTESGEPVYVRVSKLGGEIYLTPEQARSMVKEISDRLAPKKVKSAS